MDDKFDNADFYDSTDDETEHCKTPKEAIEKYIDSFCPDEDADMTAFVRDRCPITVAAYDRKKIGNEDILKACLDLVERLSEDLDEAYGVFRIHNGFTEDDLRKLSYAIFPSIHDAIRNHYTVRQTVQVAEREYSADEVIAMLKESGYLD